MIPVIQSDSLLDPIDRFNVFKKRLDDSIFKALSIIEETIQLYFNIGPNDIIYEVWINGRWCKNIDLNKSKELIIDYITDRGLEDLQVQIVINCKNQLSANDVQVFGTTINIYYFEDEEYNSDDDEYFPNWRLSIENFETAIGRPLSMEEINSIQTYVLGQIKKDFDQHY